MDSNQLVPLHTQQQQLFYGPMSGTTRVSRYQKKVKSMVDVGVRFDSNLTFRDYGIFQKINKAVLGYWVLLTTISYIWTNTLLYYFISQWCATC